MRAESVRGVPDGAGSESTVGTHDEPAGRIHAHVLRRHVLCERNLEQAAAEVAEAAGVRVPMREG